MVSILAPKPLILEFLGATQHTRHKKKKLFAIKPRENFLFDDGLGVGEGGVGHPISLFEIFSNIYIPRNFPL